MHCKPPKLKVKQQHMASLSTGGGSIGGGSGGGGAADDDGDGSRSGKSVTLVGHSPGSYAAKNSNSTNNNNKNNSGNNNNNNDSTLSTNNNNNNTSLDSTQIQLKKQTLEQRKQELEKLLSEKSWLLQQLQKQEAQILNGNYEYLNLNDIFGTLQQCKQDAAGGSVGGGSGGGGSAILRRKTTTGVMSGGSAAKENLINNNNNNTSGTQSNRHSEISNRSSEYDNYPGVQQVATQQLPAGGGILKVAQKKRVNPSNWQAANTLPQHAQQQQQLQQQHLQQQQEQLQKQQEQLHKTQLQQQQHLQQLRQHYISQMSEEQHFQYTQQQVLQHQQQTLQQHLQQQQRQMLQHQHFHPRQQLITTYHSPTLPTQAVDAISLYSANSANVATLRQQPAAHLAQMQTPITVQCDKYYLSPTHQSYNDGGFIRSSQNIKQYISPQSSPTTTATLLKPLQPLQLQLQQQHQQHLLVNNRNFDAISLSPQNNSLISPEQNNNENNNTTTTNSNLRWRSQSSIATKNHSSDTLNAPSPGSYFPPSIPKHMDDISVASFGSDTQKKQKPKQWMESSLDGPVIRSTNNNSPVSQQQQPPRPHQAKPPTQQLNMPRDRTRLSSQSMSSGAQRYNGVAQRSKTTRLLQDDDGKYAKLSQSTSYLNSMDALAVNTSYFPEPLLTTAAAAVPSPLPARSELSYNFISPKGGARLLPASVSIAAADKPALSPEIRIESPKNMTVVQQATFQPYKEITKPFEMSDFYKYSTKFKQKEPVTTAAGGSRVDAAQDK